MKNIGIVLAAGSGSRMNSSRKKQFMELGGFPVIYYSLQAMEESEIITDVIVVCGEEDREYISTNIVNNYNFSKVSAVIRGGKERYNSVMAGMDYIESVSGKSGADYVFIHDAARPFLTTQIIERLYSDVRVSGASIAGVKSKDTVKIVNRSEQVVSTPNRELVWIVQTPQVFSYSIIKEAYDKLKEAECGLPCDGIRVTDDAMVVETFGNTKVKMVEASYTNIKITTPEDMYLAEAILANKNS